MKAKKVISDVALMWSLNLFLKFNPESQILDSYYKGTLSHGVPSAKAM
jgi:hypothetical protein